MTAPEERPPFDEKDAAIVDRYLRSRGLTAFDPFAANDPAQDAIFKTSLAAARWMVEQSFGTRTKAGRRFRGYPVFVESPSPNAFAIDVGEVNIFGVHVGLVASLFEISHFVFAQATLFPEIGDPSGERSPALPEGSMLSFLMADRLRADPAATNGPVGMEFLPKDAQRNLAARILTQLMIRFAWLHEQYHALNGHCGLMAERRRGVALNEMPDDQSISALQTMQDDIDPVWRLTLHCMEFDADRTALWAMMKMQDGNGEPIDQLTAMPKTVRLKLVLFSGFMMTFLFDQSAKHRTAADGGSHPLAYHRLHNLVRTIASNLLGDDSATKAAVSELLTEMMRLRERVPKLFSAAQLLADLRDPDLQAGFDRAERALEGSRREFRQFNYVETPTRCDHSPHIRASCLCGQVEHRRVQDDLHTATRLQVQSRAWQ